MDNLDYGDLELEFARRRYEWNFIDGKFVPLAQDIEHMVDRAKKALYDENVGATFEVGRLIVQKDQYDYNVYMYMGSEKIDE